MQFNQRTLMTMDEDEYNKIVRRHILLVGVGGVGGAALECLVRFGVKKISVIDFDTVDITNLNRQIISNTANIGQLKTDVAVSRALSINPQCDIKGYNMFLSAENMDFIGTLKPDYVIDAIDSVKSKLDLIEYCRKNDIKIISAMGTGNRFDISGFVIDKVENTAGNGCGLSRVMRQELRKRGIEGHISLFNTKAPKTKAVNTSGGRHAPGSTVFAPNLAGIMIAQYVCRQLAEGK